MGERDRFEIDLAAALRAYLEDAPTEVAPLELARHFGATHPHRRGALGRWGLGPVPAMAAVLLLAAVLLAALVGGMLVVGSQLQRRHPAVVPPALPPVGQLFACPPGSTPDTPGPVEQARPFGLGSTGAALAFDRRAGRLVAVTSATGTWTFDVCTNTWARMHPTREPPSVEWARLVYDVDSDVTIGVFSGRVWAYDLQADTWTEKGAAPIYAIPVAYDGRTGRVVAVAESRLWTYDVETDAWTRIDQSSEWPASGALAYDASVDRMIVYTGANAGHETWLLDFRSGTWSRSDAVTPHVLDWLTLPAIAYDEAAKRTVVGGNVRLAAYDASALRWETIEFPDPERWHGVSLAYDPVNERLIVLPDYWEEWAGGTQVGDVLALDLETREWTVLLEPGGAQPSDTPATMPAPTSARTPALDASAPSIR